MIRTAKTKGWASSGKCYVDRKIKNSLCFSSVSSEVYKFKELLPLIGNVFKSGIKQNLNSNNLLRYKS